MKKLIFKIKQYFDTSHRTCRTCKHLIVEQPSYGSVIMKCGQSVETVINNITGVSTEYEASGCGEMRSSRLRCSAKGRWWQPADEPNQLLETALSTDVKVYY